MYSQKSILKIKSNKIKRYIIFQIAIIRQTFKRNNTFLYMVQVHVAKNIKKMFFFKNSYLGLSQNWLNLPMDPRHFWLYPKIEPKKAGGTLLPLLSLALSGVVGRCLALRVGQAICRCRSARDCRRAPLPPLFSRTHAYGDGRRKRWAYKGQKREKDRT